MNRKNRILALAAMVLTGVLSLAAFAAESKYTTSAAGSAILTFGPSPSGFKLTGLYAQSDTTTAPVVFYGRGTGSKRYTPSATPTNGQTVIALANTAIATSNGDHVVYVHANGVLDKTTVASATLTNVTLTAAITATGASGDYLYEITPVFQVNTSSGLISEFGGHIFAVPGAWPLGLVMTGGTNLILGATTDR